MANEYILHPRNGGTVKSNRFAAFGRLPGGVSKVIGFLKDAQGRLIPGKSLCLCPCGLWAIYFEVGDPLVGQPYMLRIIDGDGDMVGKATFMILPAVGISITYPEENATECTEFISYGYDNTTGATTVNGRMTRDGAADVNGTTLQGPENWVILFTDVPAAAGYTLRVNNDVEGSQEGVKAGITIQAC